MSLWEKQVKIKSEILKANFSYLPKFWIFLELWNLLENYWCFSLFDTFIIVSKSKFKPLLTLYFLALCFQEPKVQRLILTLSEEMIVFHFFVMPCKMVGPVSSISLLSSQFSIVFVFFFNKHPIKIMKKGNRCICKFSVLIL